MKHATGPRRGRPRGNGKRFSSGGGKNQAFESTGPDVKIRGTAQQVYEKYLSLARDSLSAGDRIGAEGFFQFADHYYRIVNAANGNSQGRNDRGPRIPPPPESAAGRIVIDDAAVMQGDQAQAETDDDSERRQPASESPAAYDDSERRQSASESAASHDEDQPRQADLYVRDAAPAMQAKELAEALARADSSGDGIIEKAPSAEPETPAETPDGKGEPRRRTSRLGSRRDPGRRSQPAEAVAIAAERAQTATSAADAAGPQPAKRGRGRPRKTAAKSEEPASKSV